MLRITSLLVRRNTSVGIRYVIIWVIIRGGLFRAVSGRSSPPGLVGPIYAYHRHCKDFRRIFYSFDAERIMYFVLRPCTCVMSNYQVLLIYILTPNASDML